MVIMKYKHHEKLMSGPSFRQRLLRSIYPGINMRVTVPFLVIVAIIAGIGVFIVTRLVAGSLQERFNNQLLDSAHAASNTHCPIGMINPVSSAKGMNSAGGTTPRAG